MKWIIILILIFCIVLLTNTVYPWLLVLKTKLRFWWWFKVEGHTSDDLENRLKNMGAEIIEQDENHIVYKYKEETFTLTDIDKKE